MKKIGVLCITLLCLFGCQKIETIKKSENIANLGFPGVSEDGIYHLVNTDFAKEVYFYDFIANKDIPLCSKVNCNHKNKDCDAYQLTFHKEENQRLNLPPIYFQNNIYYFYENLTNGKTILCKSDVDGTNIQELIDISNNAVITNAIFSNKKLWYIENTFDFDEKGNIQSMNNRFILKTLDLSTLKSEVIEESENDMKLIRGMYDEKIYFSQYQKVDNNTITKLVCYDEKKKKFETIKNQYNAANSFLIDKYYYYYDVKKEKIYRANVIDETKEYIMDYQPENEFEIFDVRTDDQGIMSFILAKNGEVVGESYVDLLLKKVIEGQGKVIYLKDGSYYRLDEKGMVLKD